MQCTEKKYSPKAYKTAQMEKKNINKCQLRAG